MAVSRKALVLALVSVAIALLITGLLIYTVQPPPEVVEVLSCILDNTVASIAILIVFVFILILGVIAILTSDNEYIIALGVLLMFVSIVIIITIIPRLTARAEEMLNQIFEDIYEGLEP